MDTETKDGLELEFTGNGSRRCVSVIVGGVAVYCDEFNIRKNKERLQFIADLIKNVPTAEHLRGQVELNLIEEATRRDQDTDETAESPNAVANSDDLLAAMPQEIRDMALAKLRDPLLIKHIVADIAARGVAGEREMSALTYLVGTSRLLAKPLALIPQGPSSSGKSFVIENVSELFPPETVIHATAMTPQSLFYMPPGSLSHKFVVAGERSRMEDDDRAEATRALREMLSSGKLTKLIPIKNPDRSFETKQIHQEGPIAFVETTTLTKIFNEDANRCILIQTDERPEQTGRIIKKTAAKASGSHVPVNIDLVQQIHFAMQRMLKKIPVIVPFAERLAELFPTNRVEARRAFPHLLGLIQAVALLHQYQRERDGNGQVIATFEDYQIAHRLLAGPMARTLGGQISDAARRFYERLRKRITLQQFNTKEARDKEEGCKNSVLGWLNELYDEGFLIIVEPSRGSKPQVWQFTNLKPDTTTMNPLPSLEEVFSSRPCQTLGHTTELVT
jgi:hypothetical protein